MRARARSIFGHVGLLAVASAALGSACRDDGPLSEEEMGVLRRFVLTSGPPADTSNAYENDLAAARLGRLLYFDPGFSGELGLYNVVEGMNGALGARGEEAKVSCAACHDPQRGGADHRSQPRATSLGAGYTERNAPTVINAAYSLWQFWDGHADSLWSQALAPPEGLHECNGSRLAVAALIFRSYRDAYGAAFPQYPLPDDAARFPPRGKPGAKPGCQAGDETEPFDDSYDCMPEGDRSIVDQIYANFGKAIAAYERRLVSTAFEPSPFDDFMAGNTTAMSAAAIRGARLFVGRAGCLECHSGPTFTDFSFHNVGAPQTGEYVPPTDYGRFDGITLVSAAAFNRNSIYSDDRSETATAHLSSLTSGASDSTKGLFKTPTLRNVAKTAPYMHDGAYATLWDVVNHYNFGGATGPYSGRKDPALAPLLLTDAELGDLVEFLRALDDGDAKPTDDFPDGLVTKPAALEAP